MQLHVSRETFGKMNPREDAADAKSFWDEFFNELGILRRRIAGFEERLKSLITKANLLICYGAARILI